VNRATATAHSNIALAKYWGKADRELNLPAVPSLSMTLDAMSTTTTVVFDDAFESDVVVLNGHEALGSARQRVCAVLDRVRQLAGRRQYASVSSSNNFPTAAGLASSASGFAALALAARAAAGLPDDPHAASSMARQASASAARSVFGGYVALDLGAHSARKVVGALHFPLSLVVAVTREGAKETGSTDGMEHTRATSPYYASWVASAPPICDQVEQAIVSRDLERLGPLVEHSALLMHASMLGANPAITYFSPASIAAIEAVKKLRQAGTLAYFTMDAGPHVKVICTPADTTRVAATLRSTPGVLRTIECKLGPDATVTREGGVES